MKTEKTNEFYAIKIIGYLDPDKGCFKNYKKTKDCLGSGEQISSFSSSVEMMDAVSDHVDDAVVEAIDGSETAENDIIDDIERIQQALIGLSSIETEAELKQLFAHL